MSTNSSCWIKASLSLLLFSSFLFSRPALRPAEGFQLAERVQVHGFASQAYILSSKNNFFGESEDGSFDFRELGLNTSFRPRPELLLSAQLLSRRAGKKGNQDLRLDYVLLDYALASRESGTFGLRIGRIKTPLGFYNDTRDVAFTRPSIFLPQSIYFDRTRNLALSADGINFYADLRTRFGDLFYQLELVYPEVDDEQTEVALLPGPSSALGELERELTYVSRLIFERDGGKVRLGLTALFLNVGFNPKAPALNDGTIRFQPVILSAQYNAEFWTLTSEYALRPFKYRSVGAVPDFKRTGESYYFQGTYRLHPRLEALLRYDALFQDRNNRNSSPSSFAKDWTFGLRWDMARDWMSRIEYHRVDGTAWLPGLDNPGPAAVLDRRWAMFAFLISYRF